MSLWYQPPPGTFLPPDSRTIGWSQLRNRKATFSQPTPNEDSPGSSTGGGTMLDLSSKFNWRGPQTTLNFDLTMNYADFQFQNVNDVTFDQYQFQQDVSAFMNNINALVAGVIEDGLEARVAALETWRQTGIDWTCDTGNELIVLRDWEFDSVNNKIINTYRGLTIVDGLVVGQDCSLPDGETNVTTCP